MQFKRDGISDMLLTDFEQARLSVFIKGRPKTGKTTAALSFPGPVLDIHSDVNRDTTRLAIGDGAPVMLLPVEGWNEFERVLAQARSRTFPGMEEPTTLLVDTWSFLSASLWGTLQDSKGKISRENWGVGLARQMNALRDLVNLTKPKEDHLGFHIVVTCHTRTLEEGGGPEPAIQGQFRDHIEAYFDYILDCDSELKSKVVNNESHTSRVFTVSSNSSLLPARAVISQGASVFDALNEKGWKLRATPAATAASTGSDAATS